MIDPELQRLLEEALGDSIRGLAKRIKKGEFSAADVGQLMSIAQKAGVTFQFAGKPTPLGDTVLESLSDVDPDLLN